MNEFVQTTFKLARDAVAPTSTPAAAPAVAAAPSLTNVRAAAAVVTTSAPMTDVPPAAVPAPTRKRLDRSTNVNPDVAAAGQPAKLIKLNESTPSQPAKAAPTSTTKADEVDTAAARQPGPKRVIKLGSSTPAADERKARFSSSGQPGSASAASAMDVDTSQPSLPPPKAAAPATASALTCGATSIRKLKKPGEKTYTYEDEERDRKAKQEIERAAAEKRNAELAAASQAAAAKKRIRCKVWPQCPNGDFCDYHHPTTMCTAFPACKFGDSCMFIHPLVPCRFGVLCTNAACAFSHPPGRRLRPAAAPFGAAPPAPNSVATPCKFGANVRLKITSAMMFVSNSVLTELSFSVLSSLAVRSRRLLFHSPAHPCSASSR